MAGAPDEFTTRLDRDGQRHLEPCIDRHGTDAERLTWSLGRLVHQHGSVVTDDEVPGMPKPPSAHPRSRWTPSRSTPCSAG